MRQLILLDAPVVLGWAGFRDVAQRYSLGMTEQLITEAIRAGQLARQPVRPLAQVLIGALDEAAMFIATADDPKRARRRPDRCCAGSSTGCLTASAGRGLGKMACGPGSEFQNWAQDWLVTTWRRGVSIPLPGRGPGGSRAG